MCGGKEHKIVMENICENCFKEKELMWVDVCGMWVFALGPTGMWAEDKSTFELFSNDDDIFFHCDYEPANRLKSFK